MTTEAEEIDELTTMFQSTGSWPCFFRYALALEKCLQPKKPRWADSGDG